jgi:hypothetical protein
MGQHSGLLRLIIPHVLLLAKPATLFLLVSVPLEAIARRAARGIAWAEGTGQRLAHYPIVTAQPHHGKGKKRKNEGPAG